MNNQELIERAKAQVAAPHMCGLGTLLETMNELIEALSAPIDEEVQEKLVNLRAFGWHETADLIERMQRQINELESRSEDI